MRVWAIRLPKSEVFPCSRRDVRRVFSSDDLEWVSFGHPVRTFSFDSRATRVPKLLGPVALSLSIGRGGDAYLCLFPVSRTQFPEVAKAQVVDSVLPRLAEWLRSKRRRPETAVLGHEQIIAEWDGGTHRFHEPKFL